MGRNFMYGLCKVLTMFKLLIANLNYKNVLGVFYYGRASDF